MPRLRQRRRAEVRAPRHPHQQCRHPQIREGRRGERGELERDPQRQPDELRLLCQGGSSADAAQQERRHRQHRLRTVCRRRRGQPAVRHHQGRDRGIDTGARRRPFAGRHSRERRRPWPDLHAVPSAPHRSFRRDRRAVQRQSRTRHHAEAPGQGRGGRRRDPVLGLRRCLLRHRGPAVRGRRHDRAVRTSRETAMPVIDVQVHPFDRNHPGRPWASPSHGLDSATGEEMVAAMNSVGVDGAIMVSSFSAYEYDPSYALEVYNTYPDKFRVVTPVDATNPAIDDVVAKWAATPGARGIRIRMRDGLPMDADHPGLNRAFAAAAKHGLPVNLLCWGILDKGLPHIQRHPDTVIVIDHLGLLQPARPPVPADVWADLPKLLALAQYANVRVKISGACTMSHQPFPYNDIWAPVLRIIDAFGLDRCMWGTDWTRTIGMLTYEQGVAPFRDTKRLSEGDKAVLMGGTS